MSADTHRTYMCPNADCHLYKTPVGLGAEKIGPFYYWPPVIVCRCGFFPVLLKLDPDTGTLFYDPHGNVVPPRST